MTVSVSSGVAVPHLPLLPAHLREAAARDLPRACVPVHCDRFPRRARLPQQEGHHQFLLATQLDRLGCYGTVWNTGERQDNIKLAEIFLFHFFFYWFLCMMTDSIVSYDLLLGILS